MEAENLMTSFQEFLKPDDTLKHAVNLLRTEKRRKEKAGVKGGFENTGGRQ